MSAISEVSEISKPVPKSKHMQRLWIGTWNFQGLCSERKALERGEVLSKNHIDIIGGQECWELNNSNFYVHGYRVSECGKLESDFNSS